MRQPVSATPWRSISPKYLDDVAPFEFCSVALNVVARTQASQVASDKMVLCPDTLAVGVGGMWDACAEITDMLTVLSLEIFSRWSCIRGAAYRKTSSLQRCERTSTSSPRRSGPNTCMPSWVAIAVLVGVVQKLHRGRRPRCCASLLAQSGRPRYSNALRTRNPLKSTVAQLRVRGPTCRATARVLKNKRL